jgi:hypothetical protein
MSSLSQVFELQYPTQDEARRAYTYGRETGVLSDDHCNINYSGNCLYRGFTPIKGYTFINIVTKEYIYAA